MEWSTILKYTVHRTANGTGYEVTKIRPRGRRKASVSVEKKWIGRVQRRILERDLRRTSSSENSFREPH